jgi:hypothetical protein
VAKDTNPKRETAANGSRVAKKIRGLPSSLVGSSVARSFGVAGAEEGFGVAGAEEGSPRRPRGRGAQSFIQFQCIPTPDTKPREFKREIGNGSFK